MRKLIASLYTGYVGSDTREAFVVDDDATDDEIHDIVYDMAIEHADRFGIYPEPHDLDEDDDTEYSQDIGGSFEDYVPSKHDMYRPGGGSFEQDF